MKGWDLDILVKNKLSVIELFKSSSCFIQCVAWLVSSDQPEEYRRATTKHKS